MRSRKELSGVGTVTVTSMGILNELVLCVDRERLLSARREGLSGFLTRPLLEVNEGSGTSPWG